MSSPSFWNTQHFLIFALLKILHCVAPLNQSGHSGSWAVFLYLHETIAAFEVDASALAHVGEACVLEKAQVRVLVRFKNGCRKG
jgi:hypothetical protein